MLILARIKVSGEIAGFLIYLAIIGIIGGLVSTVLGFIRDKLIKSESIKKALSRLETIVWIALFVLGILDIFGIFPTLSRLFT